MLHGKRAAEQHQAKRVCTGCPVKIECLAAALDNGGEDGVWGGMTDGERKKLLAKHPNVPSWRKVFERALADRPPVAQIPRQRAANVAGAAGSAVLDAGSARKQLPILQPENAGWSTAGAPHTED
jgi:hypothetical protein